MVAMAYTTTREIGKKPFSNLRSTTYGYAGTVETKVGIIEVNAVNNDNPFLEMDLIFNGYRYRRIFENQFYSKRYAVTLARRMADEMALRSQQKAS